MTKKRNVQIKKLELAHAITARKLNEAREKQIFEEVVPELKEYAGRCFVYRDNSYGGAKGPQDRWNVYKKVLSYILDVDGYIHYIVEEFQVDRDGKCSLTVNDMYPYHQLGRHPFDSYDEISSEEYDVERAKFFSEMSLRTKIKAILKKKS